MDRIIIGPYMIRNEGAGKLWIQHIDGEGGGFNEADLIKALDSFFAEHF